MLRGIAFLFLTGALLVVPAQPAIWPAQLGGYTRGQAGPVAVEEKEVWDEYGLTETEQAGYTSGNRSFTAFAYRFNDPTGAMAAFQWQRPADATPSKIGQLAVQTQSTVVFAFHNYLFRLEGWRPEAADLTPLLESVPRLDQSALPTLPGYMPAATRTPNSERYVLGPASLALFEPRVPPSVAAFHLGTEAQLSRFRSNGGELSLALFSFPTPNLARERAKAFSELSGALVKRSGPLVAIILAPSDPDEAQRLLSRVQYQATVAWNERVPTRRDNIGDLIINIFLLIGVLLVFSAAAGLAFGAFRVLARRYFKSWSDEEPMILLHLGDR